MSQRILDCALSICILILLFPLFLILCVANFFILGRPIFFTQYRLGKKEIPFRILKFRSMRLSDQTERLFETDQERLVPYGRFLRKYSLDEILSFLNVLKGDMALVGPRPLLPEFLAYYTPTQRRRHEVLPGMTGLAQIRGRNTLRWSSKFKYDVFYVDHRSLSLDLYILIKTVPYIVSAHGTHAPVDGYLPGTA